MKKIDYLKKALIAGCYAKKAWILSAFTLIREDIDEYKKNPYPYRIVQTPTGFYYVDPDNNGELSKIEDAIPTEPLFKFLDTIVVDNSICSNVKDPIETKIGNVIFNLCSIVRVFGNKMPFITGRVSVSAIEDEIAEKLKDTPPPGAERSDKYYYVDELIKFENSLSYIKSLANITVWSATEKTLTSAPGFKEFKEELNKKYAGKLNDPAQLALYEKELKDYDDAYLKGDPTDGIFMSGKIRNISRMKTKLTFGATIGFETKQEVTPVTRSLEEGWSTDPAQFTAMMNGSRAGSYSRGYETVNGGVSAKVLLRAVSNFKIIFEDCNTTLGIHRTFTKKDHHKLVGRYLIEDDSIKLIESREMALEYIDKPVIVRSPMYCHASEDAICQYCAGQRLSANPHGLTTALTSISSIILNTAMKAMHGKVLATNKMQYKDVFS